LARTVRLWLLSLVLSALAVVTALGAVSATPEAQAATNSAARSGIQHVVWVWMENRSYNDVIGSSSAPYLNSLAQQYGSATNAWGITHPSAPNYIGGLSGLPLAQLPATDCTTCTKPGPDLFTQVSSWRAYQESMTTPCRRTQDSGGLYVPRHNPALYFTDITPASCKSNDVNYAQLATDLANHTLPAFSFISPNLANDMHDGSIPAGDAWLSANLPALLNSPEFTSGSTVVIITFDEGSAGGALKGVDCTNTTSQSCHIPLLIISPYSVGTTSTRQLTLYSTLRATEDLLGVRELGLASSAPDLLADFGLAAPDPPPSQAALSVTCVLLSCTADASASTLPGITSYQWDFGDGSGVQTTDVASVVHHFASSGPYDVTVTVSDGAGTTATTSQQVTVASATATFTSSCSGLTCAFDASASTAPGASITAYSWDFGDGAVGSGVATPHVFTSPGTYPVVLSITDSNGDITTSTRNVTVVAPGNGIHFVASATSTANAKSQTVTIPSSVSEGNGLLLMATSAVATPQTAPSGWQVVKTASSSTMYSTVWQRVAASGDPGSSVTVTFGTQLAKGSLQLLAYSGTSTAGPVASAVARTGASSLTTFATPATTVSAPGSWVVSYWSSRSTGATRWIAPSGMTARSTSDGTGGGHIDALVCDVGGPTAVGTVPGVSASTDQASGSQLAWTLVLTP
jgi:PKD repeat protein